MKFNLESKQIFDMKNDDYEEEAEPTTEKNIHNETSDKKSAGKYSTLSHSDRKKCTMEMTLHVKHFFLLR